MSDEKKEQTSPEKEATAETPAGKESGEAKTEKAPETEAKEEKKAEGKKEASGEKEHKKEEAKKDGKKAEAKKSGPSPEEQIKEANDKYLRLLAEYDNFRKRSSKERDNMYGDIKADTVTKFLPVYDNLVRALDMSTEDEAYRRGVEMIMTQFDETLTKLGVTEIESVGKKFDPNLHNAVMHVEDDTKGENEIVEVFQKGFKLGDKVIRFAMVKVAN
jgi:molecular chaperone GrpE